MRIGYSYLHTLDGPAPDWFVQGLRDYLERFLPAYASRYLNQDVVIEPAGPVTDVLVTRDGWMPYFLSARAESTTGYDSMIIMTDAPFRQISGSGVAGTNYYLARPNFAWTSVRNWDEVDALVARNGAYQAMPPYLRRRYAMMFGDPSDAGIRALTVAGHEISHYLLLRKGGPGLSEQIDGGSLSGLAFLDDALAGVPSPRMDPPNWTWSAQRVCSCLPCQSGMGAYTCGISVPALPGRALPKSRSFF